MNTSTPLDPRSLAHRLTTVGSALHHRLFAQLRDGDLHPKTALILGVIDGRVDSPWIRERIAHGGKRVTALAERGWIERTDDGWALTAAGRGILDQMDADRAALLSDVPTEELERLVASLDAVAEAMGIDDTQERRFGPRGRGGFGPGFGPGMRGGFGPGFGPGMRGGFGPGFGPGMRGGFGPGFGSGMRRGFGLDAFGERDAEHRGHGDHGHGQHRHGEHGHGEPGNGAARGHGYGHDGHHSHGDHGHSDHGHGHHGHGERGHRAAQRAYERGFDAGFSRGRESSASE
ncbi:hypothetical protein [Microbacterium sp. Bi128]|uniref:hypothetical protein n=1 Tax=Microbacterium sp. Bi128 TaxID=2821115 RepID=UPI001DFD94B1|nr:hypothetical protein [Microbacterium sp. Bi128]CAH0286227.1 hypothetical protein SRABI128_03774 [Microbacterium sp. Bi128]